MLDHLKSWFSPISEILENQLALADGSPKYFGELVVRQYALTYLDFPCFHENPH